VTAPSLPQGNGNGSFRRFSPVAAHPREGRFTQPTAAAQLRRAFNFCRHNRPDPPPGHRRGRGGQSDAACETGGFLLGNAHRCVAGVSAHPRLLRSLPAMRSTRPVEHGDKLWKRVPSPKDLRVLAVCERKSGKPRTGRSISPPGARTRSHTNAESGFPLLLADTANHSDIPLWRSFA
jgi:hypothetical protein